MAAKQVTSSKINIDTLVRLLDPDAKDFRPVVYPSFTGSKKHPQGKLEPRTPGPYRSD